MITWPSCFRSLAEEIKEKDIQGIDIRLIFTGGELLDEYTRKLAGEAFEAELFDNYGTNEVGGIGKECAKHSGYHIEGNLNVVEIIENGENVSIGEEGEITVTNLNNYAMPFIRYNLEDLGSLTEDECSCGNCFPLMKITQGRKGVFIYLPNGRAISALRVYYDLNLIQGIKQFQVIQEKVDHLIVKIVRGSRFTEATPEEVRRMFVQKLGDVEVDILLVDDIRRERTGKFRPFITEISK
jgi:phenylacetate-CoA ligase